MEHWMIWSSFHRLKTQNRIFVCEVNLCIYAIYFTPPGSLYLENQGKLGSLKLDNFLNLFYAWWYYLKLWSQYVLFYFLKEMDTFIQARIR